MILPRHTDKVFAEHVSDMMENATDEEIARMICCGADKLAIMVDFLNAKKELSA